jgi:hypothetical protein
MMPKKFPNPVSETALGVGKALLAKGVVEKPLLSLDKGLFPVYKM